MIRTIPLNKLMPSPRNVRRTTDEQADLQLKADIEAGASAEPRGCPREEAEGSLRRDDACMLQLALMTRSAVTYVLPGPKKGNKKMPENWRARQDSNLRPQA
jgi:hypothetical protein